MTTKVNLIHGKKNAHSSEEFSGEWAFLYNGILYMSLATFSMEVAIWEMKFPLFIWQVSALSALLFTFSVQLRGAVRGLWRLLFSTKHDLGRENAILMGKCACTAGLFCNMLDRLDADPVFLSLGRAEEPAFFVDFTVKCVFHFDQKKPLGMDIRGDLDLAPGGCGAQAGFECVFQKIRQHQTQIDLVHRKHLW